MEFKGRTKKQRERGGGGGLGENEGNGINTNKINILKNNISYSDTYLHLFDTKVTILVIS